ncbi:MAG: bifunctional phosphopantothenoylcysteine decarboxylase/phosphopantothenate--cysteine ligase CoaBC [Schwartzia sp.]|nr:bifunctional phosphopantothenoylcysteine decarboxylase/phosphopantothenate--cysteine ligase CoaBC [Schwartzia sp. (in: firmicutes)]
MLQGKKILLGVTGGIAAYKAVEVVSRLRKAGAEVRVVMTKEATEFVTELTFREISGNPVTVDMWAPIQHWNVAHIALADWTDVALVAPATANILAKAALGVADDMLTTTLLAVTAPVFFAPAMNCNMYAHPAVQENIEKLAARGAHFIAPGTGKLACGAEGPGRLAEPQDIVLALEHFFAEGAQLSGVKVLVTAAGTIEPIDPVRYIGNRSSGRMGYALAEEAVARGAEVVLVSGPSALTPPKGLRSFVSVETAREMREAVLREVETSRIVIKAAAVADYHPRTVSEQKIKKNDEELSIILEKNPDILKELGQKKREGQILVGFAAETQNLLQYAKEKIAKKNLDFIVANDVTKPGAGFNTATNLVKIISRGGEIEELPLMEKREVAKRIFDRILPKGLKK